MEPQKIEPETILPFTPKEVLIVVGISGDGNALGTASYCTVLKHLQHEKQLTQAYSNSLPARVTLLGILAGLRALKGSCIVEVVVQNEIIVNAFEKGWILDWEKRGLLKRKTTQVKHTDLYAKVLDAMQGHVVTYSQPVTTQEEVLMETSKKAAKKVKKIGPWLEDFDLFTNETPDLRG